MKQFLPFLLLFLFFCPLGFYGQETEPLSQDTVVANILYQQKVYPQEKIHLHLDRDIYVPGENIWFKAYLVDAETHLSLTYSRYVYVELINSSDSLVSRVMIRPERGVHHGHIFLSEVIPEGYYTLRAYTRYMQNKGEDYFFERSIRIGKIKTAEEEAVKKTRKKREPKDDYDVSFFPEGGNLLEGTVCRVGFKVLNNKGLSEPITGTLMDENEEEITSVTTYHAGMGVFAFLPGKGKSYHLVCTNHKGLNKRFELPEVISNTSSLRCYWRLDKLYVVENRAGETVTPASHLLIHNRGNIVYFAPWDSKKNYLVFDKSQLPAGINHILLFDNRYHAISERLVFNTHIEEIAVDFHTDKTGYEIRDLVSADISVKDAKGTPLNASLSVAITDDKDVEVDDTYTIFSSLLLASEIRGHIESPGYYFREDDKDAHYALDNLMLIQGWRRYNIPEVARGIFEKPEIPHEKSQSISGKVKTLFRGKDVKNGEVSVFTSTGNVAVVETDRNGLFRFDGFELPDSTTYYVQSLNNKGKRSVELIINQIPFPAMKYQPFNTDLFITGFPAKEELKEDSFLEKATQRSKYDDQMRVVHLANVEVVARRINKKEDHLPWFSVSSDVTIKQEMIEKFHPRFVSDILHLVAGAHVNSSGRIFIRGNSSPALIVIDGIPMEDFGGGNKHDAPIESVSVHDVERIDVFKGASASIFGSRGAGGVVSVVTKRGVDATYDKEEYNQTVLSPIGYQLPVEFYSPKYETPESKYTGNPDYRTTIFWKPDVMTISEEKASFDFYTSDFPTTYSVVIEGITSEGKLIRKVEQIQVEQ